MAEEKVLKYAFYNNKFVKASQIKVNVNNLAIARGYGAFDFFRVINGQAFYVQRHIERFFNTLKIMKLRIKYSDLELLELIKEVISKNNIPNCFIKLFALPETTSDINKPALLAIQAMEIEQATINKSETGTNLLLKQYERFLPEAKSLNYLSSVYWLNEMKLQNAVDVLYYSSNNELLECSRANIFLIKQGIIFTPSEKILYGITKSIIIDLIKSKNILYEERKIDINELWDADEVFITSTIKKVMPVINIKGEKIGKGIPGPISLNIKNLFDIHLVSQGKAIVSTN